MKAEPGPARVNGWIEVSEAGAAVVLRIFGELDAASRVPIEPVVNAATDSAGSLIFELGDLTFCDSSGIAMLIGAHERAKARGTEVAMRHVRRPVRRVFEIAGLVGLIELID